MQELKYINLAKKYVNLAKYKLLTENTARRYFIFAYTVKGENMNACELTASITALANAIACNKSASEINLLAAVFSQLGDTLATITAQQGLCEELTETSENT